MDDKQYNGIGDDDDDDNKKARSVHFILLLLCVYVHRSTNNLMCSLRTYLTLNAFAPSFSRIRLNTLLIQIIHGFLFNEMQNSVSRSSKQCRFFLLDFFF